MCVIEGLDWKCFRRGFFVFAIIFGLITITGLILQYEHTQNVSTICKDNLSCPAHWHCCDMGCCSPVTASPHTEDDEPWYKQWPFVFFNGILIAILFCCVAYCRRDRRSCTGFTLSCLCCDGNQRNTEVDSAGSLYPPPTYSRCGSFPQAPPPYSEVQSKPNLYPLVITCVEGDAKQGGNYYMVHYLRDRIIRPPQGSLSATSTAESLNSSFICNATNEANSVIPPPYSSSNNLGCVGERRTMLRSVSSLNERRPVQQPRTNPPLCRPRECTEVLEWRDMNRAYPPQTYKESIDHSNCDMNCDYWRHTLSDDSIFVQEAIEVRRIYDPPPIRSFDSPPPPTSPDEPQKPTEKNRQRRVDDIKQNIKKSSLYMPLSTTPVRPSRIFPGTRATSRSAPATPSSNLVPNLLNFTHRATGYNSRSSRLEEEYDALITDTEQCADHKF